MDLPLHARHRIYAYIGLFRWCPIELSHPQIYEESPGPSEAGFFFDLTPRECLYICRRRGGDQTTGPDILDCLCPRLPLHRLLLISRAVYHDVFAAFYSRNNFVIRLRGAGGFESLHLGQHIQSTITSLLIRLNSWPCPRGHEVPYTTGLQCATCKFFTADADPPLDMTSQAGQALLHGWRRFAERLASSVSPGQLELTLICDVTDKASGMAVLEPLLRFPTLKQCVIRLGRHFNYELYQLAREASLRTQGLYSETRGIFPFQRLPRELRLKILGYTHLGDHNSYFKAHRLLQITKNRLVGGQCFSYHGSKTCCRKCTVTLVDCCCAPVRAAYSSDCECRHIPFALSRVSKEMRADVMEVLLSQNSFDFIQDPDEIIGFLRNFPQGTLKHSRRIKLQFFETDLYDWDRLRYREKLTRLVVFIRDNFELRRLSITVTIDSFDCGAYEPEYEDTRYIYDIYRDMTRAFRLLHTLEDVQFDLGWFKDLEPVMKQAILGQQQPMCLPKPKPAVPSRRESGEWFRLPTWYQEEDFTRC